MAKPRLRMFENAANQRHICDEDKYLYAREIPQYAINVIGCGTMGQEHMRVATLLGKARVHGIFDSAARSMDAAAAGFSAYSPQALKRYDSLETACMDKTIDALFICTPNFTHLDILKTAMDSGKPVFLEKPMATTLADAAAIVALAKRYSSFIQIGLQYRFKAQYAEALHEHHQRKTLGTLLTISMSEQRPPFLDKVNQWNKFKRFTGGTLVEKCCHYFDLINLFSAAKPVRVFASGGQATNFLDFVKAGETSDIDDHAFVIIEYANGIKANFTLNMFSPDFSEELVLCGEQGRLLATEKANIHHDGASQSRLLIETGENAARREIDIAYAQTIEQSGHHGATYFEHRAFMDKLGGHRTNAQSIDGATVEQGLWAMIVACAAQRSMKSGAAVDINDFLTSNKLETLTEN